MADFSFTGDVELQKLNEQVLREPEEFEHWEKLVRAAESQESGLNRNSSPQAIAATRDVYDRFLARFPLFFGYWKKYADLEFSIAGPEAAEMVYERGVASIGISVDLWANYCNFKLETTHDIDVIRELFERAKKSAGLDFLAHPFWDKYIEFEERIEAHDRVFEILSEIIHIPLHQYARYFERYRALSANRSIAELAPENVIDGFRNELAAGMQQRTHAQMEQELRARIDQYHAEIFQQTQTETTKRWTYESEVKRPYYHVTDLDDAQLANWRKYLDFEESEGGYERTKFLYERCLVTAANYDEFWFRYARWMQAQEGKEDEVRNILQRASCVFVPISRPAIRIYYAQFEESMDNAAIANDIYEAILMILPNHLETITCLANLQRRMNGVEQAIETLKTHLGSPEKSQSTRGAIVSEWARLVGEINGQVEEARAIYQSHQQNYTTCKPFWLSWFFFEIRQPAVGPKQPSEHFHRVKAVYDAICSSGLPRRTVQDIHCFYVVYLRERGGPDAFKELVRRDAEINGPLSVQRGLANSAANDEDDIGVVGYPGLDVHESVFVAGQGGLSMFPQAANGTPQNANGAGRY
ncbi:hypothetical protein NU195Hw_g3728t1 [Hortaea werneckii]